MYVTFTLLYSFFGSFKADLHCTIFAYNIIIMAWDQLMTQLQHESCRLKVMLHEMIFNDDF